MKLKILKIGLLFFSVITALIMAEFVLRVFMSAPENLKKLRSSNLFLHENNPSVTFPYVRNGEYNNQIIINSFGFRDDPFTTDKKSGVYRIAVLGDSQEEALQVDLFDTWQKVMARRLSRELKKEVETYSFGVSGYGTDQEWLTLREKVWQFSPDMVILAFSPNDVGDTYKNKLVRIVGGGLDVVTVKERAGGNLSGRFLRGTYMYHLAIKAASGNERTKRIADNVRTKILGFPHDERFFLSDAQLVEGPFEVMASKKDPQTEVLQTWEVIRALVADMKRQAGAYGAKLMITVNIPRAQVDPGSWESLKNQYHLTDKDASPHEINDVMGKIAQDLVVPYHDGRVEAIEWKKRTGLLHYPLDGHFNVNGNLFMGTKVADFIIAKKLTD